MTISTAAFLKASYGQVKALGDKSISSDAMFVIDGFEHLRLLTKQFPWPVLSTAGEIAIANPMGGESWQQQQLKTNMQGQMQFYETVRGDMHQFIEKIIGKGGKFNATVYEGSVERNHRSVKIVDCFLQLESPDRDWKNRAQATTISGTLFYHFFGESEAGNIAS